jgi:hypothetical protein
MGRNWEDLLLSRLFTVILFALKQVFLKFFFPLQFLPKIMYSWLEYVPLSWLQLHLAFWGLSVSSLSLAICDHCVLCDPFLSLSCVSFPAWLTLPWLWWHYVSSECFVLLTRLSKHRSPQYESWRKLKVERIVLDPKMIWL